MIILSRDDVAIDVAGAKICCYVVVYIHALWNTHICGCALITCNYNLNSYPN